jgi:hypothetical protein
VYPEDARHAVRELVIVRRDERADARGLHQRVELEEHAVRGGGIEVAGGLVGEEQPRRVGEGAAEGEALLLATRQFRRTVTGAGADADALEQVLRPFGGGGARGRECSARAAWVSCSLRVTSGSVSASR